MRLYCFQLLGPAHHDKNGSYDYGELFWTECDMRIRDPWQRRYKFVETIDSVDPHPEPIPPPEPPPAPTPAPEPIPTPQPQPQPAPTPTDLGETEQVGEVDSPARPSRLKRQPKQGASYEAPNRRKP